MKNYKQICREVASDVLAMIEDAVTFHVDSISYEKEFGNASVIVETGYKKKNGWLHPYTIVVVMHDDCCHTSPRLTEAIERALPKWSDIEKTIEEQMEYLA
jgi:hypothetical protein